MEVIEVSRIYLTACLIILFCAIANAQGGNVYFGYTFNHADVGLLDDNSLNGWTGSGEVKVFPFVGLVADFSGQYGSDNFVSTASCPARSGPCFGGDISLHTFLFGPRLSVSVSKFRPFAHVLVGLAHAKISSTATDSDTSFATQVGGGLDYSVFGPLSWRLEGDYLRTQLFGDSQ